MMIERGRFLVRLEKGWVLFVMGVRVNRWWKIWSWWPVLRTFKKILKELRLKPELGLLNIEVFWGNPVVTLQVWRSYEDLVSFAKDTEGLHLPAWKNFMQHLNKTEDVGIFHELYVVDEKNCEAIYNHMPRFGLGKIAPLEPVTFANYQSDARREAGKPKDSC